MWEQQDFLLDFFLVCDIFSAFTFNVQLKSFNPSQISKKKFVWFKIKVLKPNVTWCGKSHEVNLNPKPQPQQPA